MHPKHKKDLQVAFVVAKKPVMLAKAFFTPAMVHTHVWVQGHVITCVSRQGLLS